jgi:hypothetical protein
LIVGRRVSDYYLGGETIPPSFHVVWCISCRLPVALNPGTWNQLRAARLLDLAAGAVCSNCKGLLTYA